jgi:hypothetical protein
MIETHCIRFELLKCSIFFVTQKKSNWFLDVVGKETLYTVNLKESFFGQ